MALKWEILLFHIMWSPEGGKVSDSDSISYDSTDSAFLCVLTSPYVGDKVTVAVSNLTFIYKKQTHPKSFQESKKNVPMSAFQSSFLNLVRLLWPFATMEPVTLAKAVQWLIGQTHSRLTPLIDFTRIKWILHKKSRNPEKNQGSV